MQSRHRAFAELRALVRLAAPLALAQVGLMLMGFVDVAVVGRVGAVTLAGVGLGNGLFFAVSVLGLGAMMGFDPLISQAVGANEPLKARGLLWQAVWLACAIGLVLAIPIALLPLLMVPFGVAADIAQQTEGYVWVRLISLVPFFMFAGARSYLQATRRPWPLVLAVVIANVANFAMDWTFVFGGAEVPLLGPWLSFIPPLGAKGAALATSVCTVLQLGILAWGIRRDGMPGVTRALRRLDVSSIKRALNVGVPIGLQMGAEVGVFVFAGFLAARMSAEAGSAHQIALALASASFCVAVGVASAGAVRVGNAIGAKDQAGTRRAGLVAFFAGGAFMSSSAVVFVLMPETLARLLTDKPEILETAVPLLAVAAAFQISDGLQAVGAGVLRGAGDTRAAFLANLLGHYVVGLPIALYIGVYLDKGVVGLWYGLAAGLTAVAVFLLGRFWKLSSRPIRPLGTHAPEEPGPEPEPRAA